MSKKLDPRIIRTRQFLRAALLDLMAEKDYETISVQDITERARLNRATFYLHYADKHDLLEQTTRDILGELRRLPVPLAVRPAQDLELERLQAFFAEVFAHVARHQQFYAIMLGAGTMPSFAARIQDVVYAIGLNWMEQAGRVAWPMPPDILMSSISGAYLGMVRWWLRQGMPHSSTYMAQQFMQFVLYGILGAPPPAPK